MVRDVGPSVLIICMILCMPYHKASLILIMIILCIKVVHSLHYTVHVHTYVSMRFYNC